MMPRSLAVALLCSTALASTLDRNDMLKYQSMARDEVQTDAARLGGILQARKAAFPLTDTEFATLAKVLDASYQFTVQHALDIFPEDNSTYVTTGDIGQMWLRDSSVQMSLYLPLVQAIQKNGSASVSGLANVMESVMHRQMSFINTDIYGSAFYKYHGNPSMGGDYGPVSNECPKTDDCSWCTCKTCAPACGSYTYQRNFELDSLLNVLLLHYQYWKGVGTTSHISTAEFASALQMIVDVCRVEMDHYSKSPYVFNEKIPHAFKDGVGLVWSFARPSDDPAAGGYNIPENMMLVVVFDKVADMLDQAKTQVPKSLISDLRSLAATVETAIETHGVATVDSEKVYAYEVDGFGETTVLDDANMPNLLWLPYLGYEDHLQLYNNTRRFVLSSSDKNYFQGKWSGLGSQHHSWGLRSKNPGAQCRGNCIWHLGLIMQGQTASASEEKTAALKAVLSSLAGQVLLHEGFTPDNPMEYNRDWFGWADAAFSNWIIKDYLS